jgi:gliding motility-associated-like protein
MAQPSNIKGVINKYVKVLSFDGVTAVNVNSASGFFAGDTVMIIQMNGALYSTDDPMVMDSPENTGKYELTVVSSVSSNKIAFNSPLKNSYNSYENIQLIRVPSYSDALVTEKLTCESWNGDTGGILVLFVTNSLTLNADIDVSGKGFRGGIPVLFSSGKCFATSGVSTSIFHILNVNADSTSGHKGEGIVANSFAYAYGKGPAGNGGGAGTGAYSGGGGGGNIGLGGTGAKESCAGIGGPFWGGGGGRIASQYFSNSMAHRRIYLGGGGGSGIQKTNSTGTNGANGGGIVILLTPYLITNGYSIKSDGDDVTGLVSDGSSSGGGGGGGMILLAIDSVKNSLNVSAKGGKGGSTQQGSPCEGHGGGGGGGLIWYSGSSLNFAQLIVAGGIAGTGSCDVYATSGTVGGSLNQLNLPLTGFLNNKISAINKTCYRTRVVVRGSHPQGGNGTYTYKWQSRTYGSETWLPAAGRNDTIDYTTDLLTDTIQLRRIVSSDGMNDNSSSITINVFPEITNNLIDPDTILCSGSSPQKIRGQLAGGGKGNITYEWSRRTLTGSWEVIPGSSVDYVAPTDITRYYRRRASSDYCSAFDSVKVEVLPLITNNIVNPRQTICSGSVPSAFEGATPLGGAGTYYFLWQQSSDSLNWGNTAITTEDFSNPAALTQTRYYRRIVSSGLNNCCRDTSKNIKIIVISQLTNNTISDAQTICEGSKPALFGGSTPSGGDAGNGYRFQWELSNDNVKWNGLNYSSALKDFQAEEQNTTHYFRRVVFSGLNDCCKSTSNSIKVTVHPKIKNNVIDGDTTICYQTVPRASKGMYSSFSGGDETTYTTKWEQKTSGGSWLDIPGAIQLNFQPESLSDTTFYRRVITSGACTDYSNTVAINVLKNIQGNEITGNEKVCEGFPADPINSGSITGGEPGVYRIAWERSSDMTSWAVIEGETDKELQPGVLPYNTYYHRVIKSGPNDCCQSFSNIFYISIDRRPDKPEAGDDKELIYVDTTSLLAAIPEIGTGVWSSRPEAIIDNIDSHYTKVSGMKFGRYAFYWTVTNGVCSSVADSVIVNVSDLQRYTGFSPNGDGINDFFVVEGLDNANSKDLLVINRWGVEVFHSFDYQNDWEGKNKNGDPLPDDTYYYVLRVKDIYNDGKDRVYKGFIVIKR